MPPPQPLLASRIRGFVCRSCLLKLQVPRKQRTPWLSRNVTNNNGPSRSKQERERIPLLEDESTFRYFDQTPHGTRIELRDDDDEAFMASLSATIRDLEKQTGKPLDSLAEALEGEEGSYSNDPVEFLREISHCPVDHGALKTIASQNKELEAQIQRLTSSSDMRNPSSEDLLRLRETLVRPTTNAPTTSGRESVPATNGPHSTSALPVKVSSVKPGRSTMSHQSEIDIPIAQFPSAYRPKIKKMKESLDRALFGSRRRKPHRPKYNSPNLRMELWKDYLLCRTGLLSMPKKVPPGVWTGLWKVFEANDVDNLDRMAHLKYVGDDMRKAGIDMELSERVLYIESTFIHGDRAHAVEDWELAGQIPLNSASTSKEYWELGVRMFCGMGQVDRALQAAETLLQGSEDATTYRILIPVIKAFLALEGGSGVQQAWALYVRLRSNLGDAIKMEDYDTVTSIFLEAGQPELALGAFKDMMLTGDLSISLQDSTHLYRCATGTKDDLKLAKIGEGELNWEDSRTLARLPARFNNKFFFGSWIKKLIGEGELSSAKKVFDLMHERRICPSPIHMNGLIGAWFRDGTEKSRILAEDAAWKMIKARTDFVKERDLRYKLDIPARPIDSFAKPGTKSTFLVPHATIETFTVLLQQYRRRQKHDLASDLFDALKKAQIPPNTIFMNELLWMDTRAHHKSWAWNTYSSLKDGKSAAPDFETYTILWQNMKKQVDPVIGKKPTSNPSNFTTCQLLFADMAQRAPTLLKKARLPRELYDLIILCFSYEQDQPGTAVALRALQRHFHMFPSEDTARSIVLQLSRLGLVNEWGEKPRRLNLSSGLTRQRVANVTKVLQMFKKQRVEALLQQGIVFEELQAEARLEETLTLLSDLLRYTYQARNEGKKEYNGAQNASQCAASNMGVPDCVPWEAGDNE